MKEYIISIDDLKRIIEGFSIGHELEPLIRCGDCEHWTNDDCPFAWGKIENAFCSYAEGGRRMSVLIKGMEKPEHCGYCRFRYDGICHALQKTQYNMNECPLVVIDDAGLNDTISRQAAIDAVNNLTYPSSLVDVKRKLVDLPSAQPEIIRINLNEKIKVKLTDWGKEIYYHQYDRVNQIAGRKICEPKFPKEDKNGYTEFQLWSFIELYGEHMGIVLPNVIEPLEIVYER